MSGQKDDAVADADAPNVPDFVADGAIDDDGVTDAVVLPDIVRDAVMLAVAVNDIELLIEAERVTVTVYEVDIVRDDVAPKVSEPVDVDVGVDVSELVDVTVAETLYEGDDAHHAGIAG